MKRIGINMSHYNVMWWYWVVATNIVNELLKLDDYEFYLFNNKDFSLPDEYSSKKNIHKVVTKANNYIFYRLFTQWKLIKKYKIQTFYTPDQIVPLKKHCKYISTVHDLYDYSKYSWFRAFYYFYSMWFKWWLRVFLYHFLPLDKIFAKKSDYIVTPSTNSKNEIMKFFGVKSDKIIVSYWWIDHMKEYDLINDNKEYVLFPLSDCYCSNYLAFRIWKVIIRNNLVKNVYYWKPWWIKYEKFKQFENEKWFIISRKRLTEEEKFNLIMNAKCCIYISLFEWFWFVPLEVLKIWTPLIYRKVCSLGEVIGDVWLWITSDNVDDYLRSLSEIINDSDYSEELIKNGKIRSNKFTRWETVRNFVEKL